LPAALWSLRLARSKSAVNGVCGCNGNASRFQPGDRVRFAVTFETTNSTDTSAGLSSGSLVGILILAVYVPASSPEVLTITYSD